MIALKDLEERGFHVIWHEPRSFRITLKDGEAPKHIVDKFAEDIKNGRVCDCPSDKYHCTSWVTQGDEITPTIEMDVQGEEYGLKDKDWVMLFVYIASGERCARIIGYESNCNMSYVPMDEDWVYSDLAAFLQSKYKEKKTREITEYRRRLADIKKSHAIVMNYLKKEYGRFSNPSPDVTYEGCGK